MAVGVVADEVAAGLQGGDEPGKVIPALPGDEEDALLMDLAESGDHGLHLIGGPAVVEGEGQGGAVPGSASGMGAAMPCGMKTATELSTGRWSNGGWRRHRDVVPDRAIGLRQQEVEK